MNKYFYRLLSVLMLVLLAGCNNAPKTDGHNHGGEAVKHTYSGSGPLKVTATTGMVADLVRNIGGERVNVTQLMGPGVDPHLYKVSQSDVGKLSGADIIVYSGLHLEGKMTDVFAKMQQRKPVVAVTERVAKDKLVNAPGSQQADPHLWFDVSLWMQAAEATRDALSEFDAAHKAEYTQNAEKYLAEMKKLHEYAKVQLATVPKARRVLVTAHDAFGYFGKAYDVEVVGLQGISTASEYGLNDVQRMVKLIASRRIKAVFVESSVPRRSIEAVVQGCKAKGHNVVIGGTLFSDAMGAEGTPEGTYLGMVKANVDTIVNALK
jgi:manganese/zinc/iron transport system substrate-binding protein